MGFSIFLTHKRTGAAASLPPCRWIVSTWQRAAKLFLLGLFVNNGASWEEWRIPGKQPVVPPLSNALDPAIDPWHLPLQAFSRRSV